MTFLFNKLNLKNHQEILVINSPESFEKELALLNDVIVQRDIKKMSSITFAIAFVVMQKELNALSQLIAKKAKDDAILWFAYPKGTSKKFKCEFNRDNGWQVLNENGFEGVRQIAIDEDWTALRFRRIEYIRTTKRSSK